VGFEPTTSAESFVYGYLHALLNFVIPPTGGLLTRCSIFWSPSSFLSRTRLSERVWLDYGPSKRFEGSRPHRAAGSETISIKLAESDSACSTRFETGLGWDLWLFLLRDVSSSLGDVPSRSLSESVPEVVEGGEVA